MSGAEGPLGSPLLALQVLALVLPEAPPPLPFPLLSQAISHSRLFFMLVLLWGMPLCTMPVGL